MMRRLFPRTWLVVAPLLRVTAACAQTPSRDSLPLHVFAYDRAAPLAVRDSLRGTDGGVRVYAVSFASPRGGRATGGLCVPAAGSGPFAGVLLQHGMPGSAEQTRAWAMTLARHGAVVLSLDAPWARRDGPPVSFTPQDSADQVQLIVDMQRGIDLLTARRDVDRARLAYVGVSYGGAMGGLLAGVEPRVAAFVLAVGGRAQKPEESHVRQVPLAPAEIERIVRAMTAKETQFRQALNQYGFKRDAIVQTIGWGGQITGEYHRTSRFVFDDSGHRFEKILAFPLPSLQEIALQPEDFEDLGGVQAYALEADKLTQYNFSYLGKEKIDELDLYVFDVSPKVLPDPKKTKERFFQGRIWVDDQDFQIVKVRGKGVPETKNSKYPTFETYREQIDGKYWFPTYTYADDQLVFGSGQTVHMRMRVTFSDYERYKAKVRVIEEGAPGETDESKPKPTPTPTPTPAKKKPPQ
jgi:dienelactone hydrolase